MEKINPYEDMLHMPRPVSHKHKPMSLANRSAQFAPFAALTGYGEAVEETVQLVEEQFNQGNEPFIAE